MLTLATVNIGRWKRRTHAAFKSINQDKMDILAITKTKCPLSLLTLLTFPILKYIKNLPRALQYICFTITLHLNGLPVVILRLHNPPGENVPRRLLAFVSSLPGAIVLGDFNARNKIFGDSLASRNGRTRVATSIYVS